jgi:hypothetical protein
MEGEEQDQGQAGDGDPESREHQTRELSGGASPRMMTILGCLAPDWSVER